MTLNMFENYSLYWDNFHQVWARSSYPFLTCNVYTADTLRYTVPKPLAPLTLNVCSVSAGQTLLLNFSEKSNSSRLSYSDLKIENLGLFAILDMTMSGFLQFYGLLVP